MAESSILCRRSYLLIAVIIGTFGPLATSAFVTPSQNGNSLTRTSTYTSEVLPFPASSASSATVLFAVPIIENWKLGKNSAVVGVVRNHPTIPNGDRITTSPLKTDLSTLKDNMTVVTKSGSKYKLGKAGGPVKVIKSPPQASPKAAPRAASKPAPVAAPVKQEKAARPSMFASKPAPKPKPAAPAPKPAPAKTAPKPESPAFSFFSPKPAPKAVAATPAQAPKPVAAKPQPKAAPAPTKEKDIQVLLNKAKAEYNLNGKTIGNGKYVLVGKQIRSSSTRSQIYYAYEADNDGLPKGPRLTVKISPTLERLKREDKNYNSVTRGLFSGQFVQKLAFLPRAGGDKSIGQTSSALILQSGEGNLRTLLDARGKRGLSGTVMRQAAVAIAQCIQAIHSSGLVWTDLKAENFVVLSDSLEKLDSGGVKGIDLESAVPANGPPIDYSPEACPPEFAKEEFAGRGAQFVLKYNYDIWSFGVLLFELATGSPVFGTRKDGAITQVLRDDVWEPDFTAVRDSNLRDLIQQCLQRNPSKRPSITQILLHPYFLTTGIGPFSF
ncbi:MAG: hypothetical protein SGBAC_007834 [Bacillariaceae sp.]